jgi:hypothetical protein
MDHTECIIWNIFILILSFGSIILASTISGLLMIVLGTVGVFGLYFSVISLATLLGDDYK